MDNGNLYTGGSSTSQIINQSYLPDSGIPSSTTNYILPRQLGTGSTRGTQTIGVGSINIDGSDNQITIGDAAGDNITIGSISSTTTQTGVASSSISSTAGGFGINFTGTGGSSVTLGTSGNGITGLSAIGKNNASIILGLNSANQAEMLFNDSSVNRLLIGQNSTGQEVVWISATGVEVTTANPNTPGQLIFNSNQDIFKVTLTGTVTIPGTGNQSPFATGATGVTVVHNLGYIPSFDAFAFVPVVQVSAQPPVTSWNQRLPTAASDSNQMTYNLQVGTDSTNIYFVDFWANNGNTAPVQAITVTYYLFTTTA